MTYTNMAKKTPRKFKAVELDAKDAPVKNIEWEGEEISTESETRIDQDDGTGQAIILRFFEFGANVETFKQHKPTAQELFNSHMRGMESLLWKDGLKPYDAIEPRLMFSKDKTKYRFIIACIPSGLNVLVDNTRTLSQLLNNAPTK